MPSLSAYHVAWVSLTLDMGYLFTAAPAKQLSINKEEKKKRKRKIAPKTSASDQHRTKGTRQDMLSRLQTNRPSGPKYMKSWFSNH